MEKGEFLLPGHMIEDLRDTFGGHLLRCYRHFHRGVHELIGKFHYALIQGS